MDLYTAIVVITMALLVVNIVDVCTDRLADKTATIRFITVCVVIGLAQMGEWIGGKDERCRACADRAALVR